MSLQVIQTPVDTSGACHQKDRDTGTARTDICIHSNLELPSSHPLVRSLKTESRIDEIRWKHIFIIYLIFYLLLNENKHHTSANPALRFKVSPTPK